jgi:hypothetical protein
MGEARWRKLRGRYPQKTEKSNAVFHYHWDGCPNCIAGDNVMAILGFLETELGGIVDFGGLLAIENSDPVVVKEFGEPIMTIQRHNHCEDLADAHSMIELLKPEGDWRLMLEAIRLELQERWRHMQ